uniref:Uncharacterized protein n=1 Tax=Plectus sambesii TaxID=2011161 RepID=A0A914VWK5_9BILA
MAVRSAAASPIHCARRAVHSRLRVMPFCVDALRRPKTCLLCRSAQRAIGADRPFPIQSIQPATMVVQWALVGAADPFWKNEKMARAEWSRVGNAATRSKWTSFADCATVSSQTRQQLASVDGSAMWSAPRRPSVVSRSVGRCSVFSEAKDRSESLTAVLSAFAVGRRSTGLNGVRRSARGRLGANSRGESPRLGRPVDATFTRFLPAKTSRRPAH